MPIRFGSLLCWSSNRVLECGRSLAASIPCGTAAFYRPQSFPEDHRPEGRHSSSWPATLTDVWRGTKTFGLHTFELRDELDDR